MIDLIAQKIENEELVFKFEDAYMCLLDRVKSNALKKLQPGELNQECINIETKIIHHLAMSFHICAVLDVYYQHQPQG